MDLYLLLRVILGRWRLVTPIVLLSVVAAAAVQALSPPIYTATGHLALAPPEVAQAVSPPLDLAEVAAGLQLDDGDEASTFSVDPLGASTYSVWAESATPDGAVDDATVVVGLLDDRIDDLQDAGTVPGDERIDLRIVSPPREATVQPDGAFRATATVLLNDPSTSESNPYGASAATVRLLTLAVGRDESRIRFAQMVDRNTVFTVDQSPLEQAESLIEVVTWGSDPQQVLTGFDVVEQLIAEDLRQRQERAGFVSRQQVTLDVLDPPLRVVDSTPPVSRPAAAIVLGGTMVALSLAVARESTLRRRRHDELRTTGREDAAPPPGPEPAPGAARTLQPTRPGPGGEP